MRSRSSLLLLLLVVVATASARRLRPDLTDLESGQKKSGVRNPRFFLGTTTTTTTTVSTFTVCYTTNNAAAVTAVCTGKRKRAIITDPLEELMELMPGLILPSATTGESETKATAKVEEVPAVAPAAEVESSHRQSKDMDLNQLDKLREEYERSPDRGARFLFYFFTSTSTSTSTTTTSTTSVTFTDCTPATSIFSVCTG